MFATQPEIREYLEHCTDKYGVREHIRFGSAVTGARFDEELGCWQVDVESGASYTARVVVAGFGPLSRPEYPQIEGIESFRGEAFHSAQWDDHYDLQGKRVAVVGTGASAIQFVPRIAKQVKQLHLFQRTAPWVLPKPDRPTTRLERFLFRWLPGLQQAYRNWIYWRLETRVLGFTVHPKVMKAAELVGRVHIRRSIKDRALRAAVTPDYTIGCKRILLSSDYYPALQRPNVELVTDRIKEITPHGIVTSGQRQGEREFDVLIYATGFRVVDSATELNVTGHGGVKLTDAWQDGVEAYRGITVAGFPNLFMLLGPNSGLGHTSVVFMIETQIQHVMSCLRILSREKAATIDVQAPALREYNDRLQRRLRRAVWNAGGCESWYLDEAGVNRTLWPGFTFEYWARTRRARRADYNVEI
jgi:cation diffusion facilitator CzcD-associated flavoprotein CzcO